MKKKSRHIAVFLIAAFAVLMLGACGANAPAGGEASAAASGEENEAAGGGVSVIATDETSEAAAGEVGTTTEADAADPTLLYLGHASLRIVTPENEVIYIDPFAGDAYDLAADMILVTHAHSDHSNLDKVENRNDDCMIITQKEALTDGIHQTFDWSNTTIEAVEAGNNDNHSIEECVGYVLTFSNGKKVYVSGDTSTTEQMAQMKDMHIDYAFFCCDGVYNMDTKEAAECAKLVGAAHNIPYHMLASNVGPFDREVAETFEAANRLILEPGEELVIE